MMYKVDKKYYFTGRPCKRGHVDKRYKSTRVCLSCHSLQIKKYRIENGEKEKRLGRENYQKNKESLKNKSIHRYRLNRKKINKKRSENFDHLSASKYKKKLYSENIKFKITSILRSRLYYAIKHKSKKGSAVKLLGCSVEEFKKYLETLFSQGMSWDNHSKWHIDHIKPLSSFNLEDAEQLKIACHYRNLQPLWAIDNLCKSSKTIIA